MTRHPLLWIGLAVACMAAAGCRPQDPFYFHQRNEVPNPYQGNELDIQYPDVHEESLDEVERAVKPLSLDNPKPEKSWDLSLEKSVQIALGNSTVIRNLGGVVFGPTGAQGSPSAILQSPQLMPTIYMPALEQTNPRSGAEAALSLFDAQLLATLGWDKLDTPQNVTDVPGFFNSVRQADDGTGRIQITKTAATGDQFGLTHNVFYEMANSPRQIWHSSWTPSLQADVRHPFLQGSGIDFNRIAGPNAQPGLYNGVLLARIRADMSLADFEGAVRNMVADVERSYWNLYFVYRRLNAAIAGRDASLQTWRQVHAKLEAGSKGGTAQEESQARQQYFVFLAEVQRSQANLYQSERALRYMLGLSVSDGRLIYPSDEPTTAKVAVAWEDLMPEALVRSVELRRQKWRIKQAQLEEIAAKNFLLPRLDGVAWYRFVGLGENMVDYPIQRDASGHFNSGYGSLADGVYQEWHMGLEFRMPFGFRREMAGVRNAQLSLVREKKILQEQELELSHQMANSWADLSLQYELSQTRYNQLVASEVEVKAVRAAYDAGSYTIDQVLDAQRRRAEAETQYYQSLVDYNLALMSIHLRKGSLLEYHGVILAEGPWPAKAYFDARRRAHARDAARMMDYGITRPRLISEGPIEQAVHGDAGHPRVAPQPAGEPTLATPAAPAASGTRRAAPAKTPAAEPVDTKTLPEAPDAPEPVPAPKPTPGLKSQSSNLMAPRSTVSAAARRNQPDIAGNLRGFAGGTSAASPTISDNAVSPASAPSKGPSIAPASGVIRTGAWMPAAGQ